jgi:TfoX/Sxy family transcriptional regulator of competence genes
MEARRDGAQPMKMPKSPPELIDVFASVLPGPPATGRKMFGYPAGFVNGNLFMSLFGDQMILRLPDGARQELLKQSGAKPFEPMKGRPMKEYVSVPKSMLKDSKELDSWISRAFEYGASLKPKTKNMGKPAKKAKSR